VVGSVIVILIDAGIVAALGNGNDAVRVIDIVDDRISGIDEPCQHRHGTLQQFDPTFVQVRLDQLVDPRWAADSIADPLANRVVLRLVGSRRPAASLGDVLRNRLGRPPELIGQVGVTPRVARARNSIER
jgi:hypothetical protein